TDKKAKKLETKLLTSGLPKRRMITLLVGKGLAKGREDLYMTQHCADHDWS
ncbi:hypothetical protein DPMN_191278, partial [Dreissena polymorpha]